MTTNTDMEDAFWEFLKRNPTAYDLFEKFTLEVISLGRKHFGAKAIAEQVRWRTMFQEKGSQFKLNNNHICYLARMFEVMNPKYEGFFFKRSAQADSAFLFNAQNFYKRSDPAFFAHTKTPKGEMHEAISAKRFISTQR